jgi:hypothetical protein
MDSVKDFETRLVAFHWGGVLQVRLNENTCAALRIEKIAHYELEIGL